MSKVLINVMSTIHVTVHWQYTSLLLDVHLNVFSFYIIVLIFFFYFLFYITVCSKILIFYRFRSIHAVNADACVKDSAEDATVRHHSWTQLLRKNLENMEA